MYNYAGGKVVTFCAMPCKIISSSDKKMLSSLNESQCQILSRVALYLQRPTFSHEQLYVLCSYPLVKIKKGRKVVCCDKHDNYINFTNNVVYKRIPS